jgi:ketosteroid isomerase-like protein
MKPRWQKPKRQLPALTLVLSIAAASAAPQPAGPQTAPASDARGELLALEEQWTVAEEKRDAAALGRILDDRFVATFGAARTYDKEAFIQLFSGEVDGTASHALTYEAVIIDGDTAVLIGIYTARGTRGGAAYTAIYRYTTTYIRRGGRWRALAEHIVRAPQ